MKHLFSPKSPASLEKPRHYCCHKHLVSRPSVIGRIRFITSLSTGKQSCFHYVCLLRLILCLIGDRKKKRTRHFRGCCWLRLHHQKGCKVVHCVVNRRYSTAQLSKIKMDMQLFFPTWPKNFVGALCSNSSVFSCQKTTAMWTRALLQQ